jgi:hypothetical protein
MIRINLLPEKDARRRGNRAAEAARPANQTSPVVVLIILALMAGCGCFYYLAIRRPLQAKTRELHTRDTNVKGLDTEIRKIRDEVTALKQLETAHQAMLDILYALDPEDRLLWSQKLNQISDLVPDNVFVTHLTVTETITKKETPGSIKRRTEAEQRIKAAKKKGQSSADQKLEPPPAPVFYPEIVQKLTIEGIAASESEPERINLMNEFYDNLMKGQNPKTKITADFMKGFRPGIQLHGLTPATVGGRGVAKFSFTIDTVPTLVSETGKAGAQTAPAAPPEPNVSPKKRSTRRGEEENV